MSPRIHLPLSGRDRRHSRNLSRGASARPRGMAEAIAPDVLARIVRDAIESRIDHKALRRVLAREKRVRKQLIAKLDAQEQDL
jgi:hypothetical protein